MLRQAMQWQYASRRAKMGRSKQLTCSTVRLLRGCIAMWAALRCSQCRLGVESVQR